MGGLTGCSHADQHRGEVEGPRCRADEHGDVAAGHGAQTELNACRFSPTRLNDLCQCLPVEEAAEEHGDLGSNHCDRCRSQQIGDGEDPIDDS